MILQPGPTQPRTFEPFWQAYAVAGETRRVRGLFSAKVPNSSFAEVRMGLLIKPTIMEDEDEEQENEKEDERDGEECRAAGQRVSDQTTTCG